MFPAIQYYNIKNQQNFNDDQFTVSMCMCMYTSMSQGFNSVSMMMSYLRACMHKIKIHNVIFFFNTTDIPITFKAVAVTGHHILGETVMVIITITFNSMLTCTAFSECTINQCISSKSLSVACNNKPLNMCTCVCHYSRECLTS